MDPQTEASYIAVLLALGDYPEYTPGHRENDFEILCKRLDWQERCSVIMGRPCTYMELWRFQDWRKHHVSDTRE